MVYEFEGAVSVEYPAEVDRPKMRQTFILEGIAVTWDAAPTTSENIRLSLELHGEGVSMEPLVVSFDPSDESATSWVHMIADCSIPLPVNTRAKVEYTNTDATLVKVGFLGYWR
ncbi:hypothetical protein F4Z99_19220 [Candidatus Poribacteria bacterium]|nr:hypothetical protein [Candidatus Poribacteria bacterium]